MNIKQIVTMTWSIGAAAALIMGALTNLVGITGASQSLLIGFVSIIAFDVAKASILSRGK